MVDPDPRVSGAGLLFLKDNGVDVKVGVEGENCKFANAPFVYRVANDEPYCVLWTGLLPQEKNASLFSFNKKKIDQSFNDINNKDYNFRSLKTLLKNIVPEVDSVLLTSEDFFSLLKNDTENLINAFPSHVSIVVTAFNFKTDKDFETSGASDLCAVSIKNLDSKNYLENLKQLSSEINRTSKSFQFENKNVFLSTFHSQHNKPKNFEFFDKKIKINESKFHNEEKNLKNVYLS
jgi:hypothetical protein